MSQARRSGWGGRREGAGRKPRPGRRLPRTVRKRVPVSAQTPVHVVLPVTHDLGSLRRGWAYDALRDALATAHARGDFRIVHVGVGDDQLEMVAEADDEVALARGMQGFQISAARRLNQAITRERGLRPARRGRVFLTRYHVEVLRTPAEARHAVGAVHGRAVPAGHEPLPVAIPWSWLLTVGIRTDRA